MHSQAVDIMLPDIPQYFAGKTIFITGGTGFLGKILLEKLLRDCPDVRKIYLLMRQKKGVEPEKRLAKLFQLEIFSFVQRPNFADSVQCIIGNIKEERLGISSDDYELLTKEVDIVFHLAATIKFDEPLSEAISLNISGVKKVIDLCLDCHHLDVLVHVSTAYANCDRRHIAETVYRTNLDPEWLMEAAEWMNEEALTAMTPLIIRNCPNTYTFTKALAECLVEEAVNKKGLRAAIFRPSIVSCVWKDPLPGWIDNYNGPSGIFASLGKGILRSMMGNTDAVADFIPVDVCANMMIAIAWMKGCVERNDQHSLKVYHCTSGQLENPCTWGIVEKVSTEAFQKHIPLEGTILRPCSGFTTNRAINYVRKCIEQRLPAYLIDLYLKCLGQEPMFWRVQKRVDRVVQSLEFFTLNQWQFSQHNAISLLESLSELDKQRFNFDISNLNWERYLFDYCLGTKKYLLKEDIARNELCLKRIERIWKIQLFITLTLPSALILCAFYRWPKLRLFFFTLFRRLLVYFAFMPSRSLKAIKHKLY